MKKDIKKMKRDMDEIVPLLDKLDVHVDFPEMKKWLKNTLHNEVEVEKDG